MTHPAALAAFSFYPGKTPDEAKTNHKLFPACMRCSTNFYPVPRGVALVRSVSASSPLY